MRADFDGMLDVLADVQRRRLLVELLAHNPQDERVVGAPDVTAEDEAVDGLTRMRHVHLPKLVEYGFVEWNEEAHEISKGPNFDEIRPLLQLLADHEEELPPDWL